MTSVYRFNGTSFTKVSLGLTDQAWGAVAWGDYDGDDRIDLAMQNSYGNEATRIFHNNLTAFVPFVQLDNDCGHPSPSWGDYNNDGKMDLAVAGVSGSIPRTRVYRNNGTSFGDVGPNIVGIQEGCVAWGDYDNDGDLDLAITGLAAGNALITKIFRNDGNGIFTDVNASQKPLDY